MEVWYNDPTVSLRFVVPCPRGLDPAHIQRRQEIFNQGGFAGARTTGDEDKSLTQLECIVQVFACLPVSGMAETKSGVGRHPERIGLQVVEGLVHNLYV